MREAEELWRPFEQAAGRSRWLIIFVGKVGIRTENG
jgi:hypothetical protein